jgi:hypothetical protein
MKSHFADLEKIFVNFLSDKGLASRMHKDFPKLDNKQCNKNHRKDMNRHTTPNAIYMMQINSWKVAQPH